MGLDPDAFAARGATFLVDSTFESAGAEAPQIDGELPSDGAERAGDQILQDRRKEWFFEECSYASPHARLNSFFPFLKRSCRAALARGSLWFTHEPCA